MESDRSEISTYIERASRPLDIAVFVGGSILESRYENLIEASRRGVRLRFLMANATSGWPDELAQPFGLHAKEYAQRIYVNAARALMLDVGTEVRWQPFPIPWSFVICDEQDGYVKGIEFLAPAPFRAFQSGDLKYFQALFAQAWSLAPPVQQLSVGAASESLPTLRVFLCHASDDKPAVRSLYERLSADGVAPWLDTQNLVPGQHWKREISRAIRESDVFVVCMSATSVGKRGFLQHELRVALQVAEEVPHGTIFIVPARLDECRVPDELRHLHWVDLFKPEGYEALLRSLQVARRR